MKQAIDFTIHSHQTLNGLLSASKAFLLQAHNLTFVSKEHKQT